jgi:hypothetical protein
MRWIHGSIALLFCVALFGGCLPRQGTPVFVDTMAADAWSGKGVLLETSPDQRECRVVFRDDSLITRERWVDCRYVHPRKR